MAEVTKAVEAAKGQIASPRDMRQYVLGGHARFTIQGREARYTYKVWAAAPRPGDTRPPPWFVRVLTGPENDSSYTYAGLIGGSDYVFRPAKPKLNGRSLPADAPSVQAFAWAWARIREHKGIEPGVFYHSGRCARCGRMLTTPESVERGLGPECAMKGVA